MTKAVNFNIRMTADPTKAEEIEVLHKLANQLEGSDTYLEMLFSPSLVDFVQGQIESDFSPELDGVIREVNRLERNAVLLEGRLQSANEQATQYFSELRTAESKVQKLQEELNAADQVIQNVKAQVFGVWSRVRKG